MVKARRGGVDRNRIAAGNHPGTQCGQWKRDMGRGFRARQVPELAEWAGLLRVAKSRCQGLYMKRLRNSRMAPALSASHRVSRPGLVATGPPETPDLTGALNIGGCQSRRQFGQGA